MAGIGEPHTGDAGPTTQTIVKLLRSQGDSGLDLGLDGDSESEGNSGYFSEDEKSVSDAQRHWDESLKQLETALILVLCPVLGRAFGRKFAQYLWVGFVNRRWRSYASKME